MIAVTESFTALANISNLHSYKTLRVCCIIAVQLDLIPKTMVLNYMVQDHDSWGIKGSTLSNRRRQSEEQEWGSCKLKIKTCLIVMLVIFSNISIKL